ncbi:MAG: hypothetical protein ACRCWO_08090 [Bosea sp. (in: a-proteobacteria)]
MSQTLLKPLADGEFEITPADTRLQSRALRNGSPAEIARLLTDAESALGALRSEFDRWLEGESERLGLLLADFQAAPGKPQLDLIYRALHDMRGNAPMFGNQLAGRIADGACKLIDAAGLLPEAIIAAHVQAIQAVIRERATDTSHPIGGLMLAELGNLARSVPLLVPESDPNAA